MLTEEENIKRVEKHLRTIITGSEKALYVVVDGDRTLIPSDSTLHFFEALNIEYDDIRRIFMEYGYSFTAFHNVALYYSCIDEAMYDTACRSSAKRSDIYPDFLVFFKAIRAHAEVILVTSGIAQGWKNIINNHSLGFIHVLGGNYLPKEDYVIDKRAKGNIIRSLKEADKKVFAFGDTMIDFEMLSEADHSFLVVNEKLNHDILPFSPRISHLKQVSFSGYYHRSIPPASLVEIQAQILAYNAC